MADVTQIYGETKPYPYPMNVVEQLATGAYYINSDEDIVYAMSFSLLAS